MELTRLIKFLLLISIVSCDDDVFEEQTKTKDRAGQRTRIATPDASRISDIRVMLNGTKHIKPDRATMKDIYDKLKRQKVERKHHDEPIGTYEDMEHETDVMSLSEKVRKLKVTKPAFEVNRDLLRSRLLGDYCDFEFKRLKNGSFGPTCMWTWNDTLTKNKNGLGLMDAVALRELNRTRGYTLEGPSEDADGNVKGHFLYLPMDETTQVMTFKSPYFPGLWEFCKVEMMLHTGKMLDGAIRVIIDSYNGVSWIVQEFSGNFNNRWQPHSLMLGKVNQNLRIAIEVERPMDVDMTSSPLLPHFAVDNIRMIDCFPDPPFMGGECQPGQFKCRIGGQDACIKIQQVCDLVKDCDDEIDELLNCDKIPHGGYCSFEKDDCGFEDKLGNILKWVRHSGPTPTDKTGPNFDHTCGSPTENVAILPPMAPTNRNITSCEGWYFYVNMNVTGPNSERADFASNAIMTSVVFNPPPKVHGDPNSNYYNSCMIRFYYQQNGRNFGSISVSVISVTNMGNLTTNLWFSSKDKGAKWYRAAMFLPNITSRYYFEFTTRMGMRIYSDAAIDDFSMAPECFGLNIPPEELGDYNYYDPVLEAPSNLPHKAFDGKPYYVFTTCNNTGRYGPSQEQCDDAYNNTELVTVLENFPMAGVQTWETPSEGYYTIIAVGASGGLGSAWRGLTQGAHITTLVQLQKGELIHMMIGQQGVNSCKKTFSTQINSTCAKKNQWNPSNGSMYEVLSKTRAVMNTKLQDGGGGGGGATYVFTVDRAGQQIPLVVAGGGGGLSVGMYIDQNGTQHGHPITTNDPRDGMMGGEPGHMAGAGGGQMPQKNTAATEEMLLVAGKSLSVGGIGGAACAGGIASGGWGGGGGACKAGGGGGGYIGGNADKHTNGHGGWSYVDPARTVAAFTEYTLSIHMGPGRVIIIPANDGCGCDYRCVAMNEYRSKVRCFCPKSWESSDEDETKCVRSQWERLQPYMVYILSAFVAVGVFLVVLMCLYLYNQMLRRKENEKRKKNLEEHAVQLRRLRTAPSDNMLENFNPYYGFDGILAAGIDVRGLPQVSRESLKLVKALGQGAFGEVYQGLYKHRACDSIEMAVAVKTLPELSSSQAEADFLMEAAIMAKFNHPNIVHLIGVCFDSHPRFIVLELLAGGDLKNFLRESRPKVERCSTLTMKDLLLCSVDVARGCKYMEAKRFIHRDIAARNCLLTTRGPGRVVKIADFGMSRDIYRSDYYRKGGKALLPIKWMPPEAYMDGVFTTKTDVWSFGVLLWEVFSLGIMPYTGCANKEVMDMVSSGGRLEAPLGCPAEIYKLMCEVWNPSPDQRPTFVQIYDRLIIMQEDPEIIDMPLPVTKPIMSTDSLSTSSGNLQLQRDTPPGSDYLVPRHHTTSRDDLRQRDTVASSSSTDPLLDHSDNLGPDSPQDRDSECQPLVKASREYGNILGGVASPKATEKQQTHGNVFANKNTNTFNSKISERNDDKVAIWETSFTETPNIDTKDDGPPVEKLISIDTPQQTPTSLVPPDNNLTAKRSSPDQKSTSPKLSKKPLTLDASQLEQNLNALKKNRGSVNLNNMNIQVPAYINVVTPRVKESKTIQIDPKKAVITDLNSPVKTLKPSTSEVSLLNGPLTEVPFADSESSNSSDNFVKNKKGEDRVLLTKQTSNSLNESEISC